MKMDPDPFDERHPSRADPDCALGHILKVLFRKDSFMNKVTVNLCIKACFKKFY
jgi:HIV-1 Vpr-binding protein